MRREKTVSDTKDLRTALLAHVRANYSYLNELPGAIERIFEQQDTSQQLERLVKAGQAMRDAVERMMTHQGIALGYTVEGQQCIEWDAALADVEARTAGLQRHPGA